MHAMHVAPSYTMQRVALGSICVVVVVGIVVLTLLSVNMLMSTAKQFYALSILKPANSCLYMHITTLLPSVE